MSEVDRRSAALQGDAFGTSVMGETLSDLSLIFAYAEVEVALAKAETRCGAGRCDVSAR